MVRSPISFYHFYHEERIMTRTKAYQNRQAKTTQHRRRKAPERLQRDQAQPNGLPRLLNRPSRR
jgi:hypothetical protein